MATKYLKIFLSSKNYQIFKFILIIFLCWRVVLIIITFYGASLLPIPNRTTHGYDKPSSVNYWKNWANWDSALILNVVESGYTLNKTPFFPLYPILIRAVSLTGLNFFWSGFLITQISTIIALFFLYKLVLLDFGENLARKTVILLLVFPTSFYLGALYSESLFLGLSVSAFYFARKRSWLLASILAGFSAISRLIGVAVIISIFAEYFFTQVPKFKIKYLYNTFLKRLVIYLAIIKSILELLILKGSIENITIRGVLSSLSFYGDFLIWPILFGLLIFYALKFLDFRKIPTINTLYLSVSTLPLLCFMVFLYIQFNNPLAFLVGHENWGRHFTMPLITVLSHFRQMLPNIFVNGFANQFQLELISFLILSAFFCLGLYRLRFSYIVYFALSILIPLSSGKLMSLPRIALMVFPMFIVIALIKNKTLRYSWIFLCTTMLAILTVLYFNSYWVA